MLNKILNNPMLVVIEVRGGSVQEVFSNLPINVMVVDWDNDEEDGNMAICLGRGDLDAMDEQTKGYVAKALDPYWQLSLEQRNTIQRVACETVIAGLPTDALCAKVLLREHIAGLSVEQQLDVISTDPVVLKEKLGFDPTKTKDDNA